MNIITFLEISFRNTRLNIQNSSSVNYPCVVVGGLAVVELAAVELVAVELVAVEPVAVEPVAVEPVAVESVAVEVVVVELVDTVVVVVPKMTFPTDLATSMESRIPS